MKARLWIPVPGVAVVRVLGEDTHPPDRKTLGQCLVHFFEIGIGKTRIKLAEGRLINILFAGLLHVAVILSHPIATRKVVCREVTLARSARQWHYPESMLLPFIPKITHAADAGLKSLLQPLEFKLEFESVDSISRHNSRD
tara:strand:+ start:65 stop:487 length:423 start_codon:yes stop_codon:yes gene_type:complete